MNKFNQDNQKLIELYDLKPGIESVSMQINRLCSDNHMSVKELIEDKEMKLIDSWYNLNK